MAVESLVCVNRLSDWVTPPGEDGVEVRTTCSGVEIDVYYEATSEYPTLTHRTLVFSRVVELRYSAVPGAATRKYSLPPRGNGRISDLVEYINSPVAKLWDEHFKSPGLFHHYYVYFPNENCAVELVARSFDGVK